jgi:hypothetical protein
VTEYGYEIWIMECKSCNVMTVSRELARYKLNVVGVQEVRWEVCGTKPAREYIFFY